MQRFYLIFEMLLMYIFHFSTRYEYLKLIKSLISLPPFKNSPLFYFNNFEIAIYNFG